MSPLLLLPGAVAVRGDTPADGVEPETGTVAAHYGGPIAEQRPLEAGESLVDLSHHGIITVAGPDRLTWLDSMTSQSLARLAPGESAETLLLTPQGRVQHAIRVYDDGETAWLLVDQSEAASLTAFLSKMKFMLRVEITDRSETHATLGSFAGGLAEQFLGEIPHAVGPWQDPWQRVQRGGWLYADPSGHPGDDWHYRETVVPREALVGLAEQLAAGAPGTPSAAGVSALEALRLRAWRPSRATEVDDRSLPHELDWLRSAVHLTKGCYRGQETVAKVHNLGHPPRRLVLLQLDGTDATLPEAGDLVFEVGGEKPVGRVTQSARHFEWGGIALALLKRAVPVAAQLEVRTGEVVIPAAQEIIVPPEAGATRDIPKLRRL